MDDKICAEGQETVDFLKECLREVLWMAIRYAHGRHTYAPHRVREVVNSLKKRFPEEEWPKKDSTIKPPKKKDMGCAIALRGDYLDDLFE